MTSKIVVIHRRIERLEEQGASNAGFANEIDHLLARVAEIEKHPSLDKQSPPTPLKLLDSARTRICWQGH